MSSATGNVEPDLRLTQLQQLLARLPPDKAERLRDALRAQAGGGPVSPMLGEILGKLSLRAGDGGEDQPNALMRRLCTLFEPFLVSDPGEPQPWHIARASLMPWWRAAMTMSTELQRCEQDFIAAVRAQRTAKIEESVGRAYDCLAPLSCQIALPNPNQDPGTLTQDLAKLNALLEGRAAFNPALAAIGLAGQIKPGREIEIDERLLAGFVTQYGRLARESALDPLWLGHAVTNRLARPWTGMRLVRAVIERGDLGPLAHYELAPLVSRALGQLAALTEEAEAQLRRAARIRRPAEIAGAAAAARRYFAALDETEDEVSSLSLYAEAQLIGRDRILTAIADTLGLFEGVIASFLRRWSPKDAPDDDPEFMAALDAADLLGVVKDACNGRFCFAPAHAAGQRLGEVLRRTPPSATGPALQQWSRHSTSLAQSLRLAN
jgi:hypothetical protein